MEAKIHPTAVIDPESRTRIEAGAEIGPYAVIGENVEIGYRKLFD